MRNRTKGMRSLIKKTVDEQAKSVVLPTEEADNQPEQPPQEVEKTLPVEQQTTQEQLPQEPGLTEQEPDDDWIDGLTGYEPTPEQPPVQEKPIQQAEQPPVQPPVEGTDEQKQRLAELYADLEFVDGDVAAEITDKIVAPKLGAIQAELEELKRYRQQEKEARQREVLIDINTKIFDKYPKAQKILNSKEFMDYVNSQNNPYSTETEHQILMKAYYAGDAGYVLGKIDGFVSTRGKPKPPVGAEPHQGGGQSGVADTSKGKKPMSEAEYRAKRNAIRAAPKGTYPPNALKDLVNEYLNSRGKNG